MKQINLFDFQIIPLYDTVWQAKISDEEYFSSSYKKYLSNSRLKYIEPEEGGPETYFEGIPFKSTPSLQLGSAVHQIVLQSESFLLSEPCNKPTGKLGMVAEKARQYRKSGQSIYNSISKAIDDIEYYVKQNRENLVNKIIKDIAKFYLTTKDFGDNIILLDDTMLDKAKKCIYSINSNRHIYKKLHPVDEWGESLPSFNEDALFMDFKVIYKDQEIIIPFKMKADNWTVDIENKKVVLNDLKTTSKWVSKFMLSGGSWDHFVYARQMYVYALVLAGYCRKQYGYDKSWTMECNMLVVETETPEHKSECFNVPRSELIKGMNNFNKLISEVAYYTIYGCEEKIEFI